jgi:O-antigen/teichoic acid export membrane protein
MRARLGKGVAWSLAGTVATNGGTFALNVIVANLLGRQVFGEYAMLQSTWLMIAAVAQLATGYTATKHVAEFRSSDPARTGRVLGVCTVVSAVAATLAPLSCSSPSWPATRRGRWPGSRPTGPWPERAC